MKTTPKISKICPKCGAVYNVRPAISRTAEYGEICPDCGTREALESIGVDKEEQEKILAIIHRSYNIYVN